MKAMKSAPARATSAKRSNEQNTDPLGYLWLGRHHITLSFRDGSRTRLTRVQTATLKSLAKTSGINAGEYVSRVIEDGIEKFIRLHEGGAS